MADNRYPKKCRLLSASDFAGLKGKSKTFSKPGLRVYYYTNALDNSRLGISVTKKMGNAVMRNRCKRLCRESFRKSTVKYLNYDFLFVVQKNFSEQNLLRAMDDFFNYLVNIC